jgi:ribokinase
MRKQIVVVGSVNLDLAFSVERIPAPGETIMGCTFRIFQGGKGANQAVAVARLGYPVSMVAKVGDDVFGPRLRQGLRSAGVNVKAVTSARHTSSGVALISATRQGQNSIVVVLGANGKLSPGNLRKASVLLRSAGIILTQLEISLETVEFLAALARRHDIPLMLDPAPARELPRDVLRSVSYLTPNETEICILCGLAPQEVNRKSVREYAQALRSRGPKNVIVKMGSQGAYTVGSDGQERFVPAFKVRAVDSTAAGDAFNAGLAVALMKGRHLEEAVWYASAAGALSVMRMGAQPSMPTAREVRRFLGVHGRGCVSLPKTPFALK